jgi:hypothetical protein
MTALRTLRWLGQGLGALLLVVAQFIWSRAGAGESDIDRHQATELTRYPFGHDALCEGVASYVIANARKYRGGRDREHANGLTRGRVRP